MKITVKLFGKPIDLELEPDCTIKDVKKKIKEKENINVELQRLVYQHKPLDHDERTIKEYKIKHDSILYLMLRLFINRD
jgi:hypothetical protein